WRQRESLCRTRTGPLVLVVLSPSGTGFLERPTGSGRRCLSREAKRVRLHLLSTVLVLAVLHLRHQPHVHVLVVGPLLAALADRPDAHRVGVDREAAMVDRGLLPWVNDAGHAVGDLRRIGRIPRPLLLIVQGVILDEDPQPATSVVLDPEDPP